MAEYGWDRFEWDDEKKKNANVQHLRDHDIDPDEAEECFFHDYELARDDTRFDDVHIIDGRTDRGRRLRLVFQDKGDRLARVFTGWELKPKKKKMVGGSTCFTCTSHHSEARRQSRAGDPEVAGTDHVMACLRRSRA